MTFIDCSSDFQTICFPREISWELDIFQHGGLKPLTSSNRSGLWKVWSFVCKKWPETRTRLANWQMVAVNSLDHPCLQLSGNWTHHMQLIAEMLWYCSLSKVRVYNYSSVHSLKTPSSSLPFTDQNTKVTIKTWVSCIFCTGADV
jgi:hypothetical protein